MKHLQAAILVLVALSSYASAQMPSISSSDLKALEGVEWVGELTYLDYSSNKKTSIKSNLRVSAMPNATREWQFEYIYPDEPKANGKSAVSLSTGGRTFNQQNVIEATNLADGTKRVVATKDGTDNDKKALFRFTYLISPTSFSIKKEVKVEGTDKFFERNTYAWRR